MSDMINGLADDVSDVARVAQKQRKSDRGFVGAMANGVGLVAMRLCFILMTIIVGGLVFIAESTVRGLHEDIKAVSDDMKDLTKSFDRYSKNTTAQLGAARVDITRLQEQELAGQDRFNDFIRADHTKNMSPLRP